MNILFYVPDNQVTDNFVPQLWPILLQHLTPPEHPVFIIDGNVERYDEAGLVEFIHQHHIELVGMGFMTRMAQKAYRMADAIRAATTIPVIMGGPHVSALPEEALGSGSGPQHADAVVIGEAEDLWLEVIRDVADGRLRPMYQAPTCAGAAAKPSLQNYPIVPWDQMNMDRFDLMRHVPGVVRKLFGRLGIPFQRAFVIPVETGRGCPYGCEFCSVTGFFGGQVRFRTTDNVIEEIRRLKVLGRRENALMMVFFVDDNFAIDRRRTKDLLRRMIAEDVCIPWVGQVSINLLRDEELVELMSASGCRWIFVGLESVVPASLAEAHKDFNKPGEYAATLALLAKHDVYAITSFIYGLDGDETGVSNKTLERIGTWPPVLPVFGLLTPYPATPLYRRLEEEGRLSRPLHWLDFQAFKTAFTHRLMTASDLEAEVHHSWLHSYRQSAFRQSQRWLKRNQKNFGYQFMHFISRLFFRGIYFPQKSRWAWFRLLIANTPTIISLIRSGLTRRSTAAPADAPESALQVGPAVSSAQNVQR